MFRDPVRDAKIFKVLSHHFTKDYKYSMWIDGNFVLKKPAKTFVKECLKDNNMAVFQHNIRNCIYHEGKYDVLARQDQTQKIEKQLARYRSEGHPVNWGLFACGVIIRKRCKTIEKFNNAWWSEICIGSSRDQTSFAYLIRKLKVKIGFLNRGSWEYFDGREFGYYPHKRGRW